VEKNIFKLIITIDTCPDYMIMLTMVEIKNCTPAIGKYFDSIFSALEVH
jgi:hypothetical protein